MVTDQGVGDRGIRPDIAVPADMHAIADDAAGGNGRAAPDARLGADHRARLHDGAWLEPAVGMDLASRAAWRAAFGFRASG